MISKKVDSEPLIVHLWASCAQLTRTLACVSFEQDFVCDRSETEGLLLLCPKGQFWQLGLELSKRFSPRIWEQINVRMGELESFDGSTMPQTLQDVYHRHVIPWLFDSIGNREMQCYRRPIVSAKNSETTVAEEVYLHLESAGRSVCTRDLFSFADQYGLHQDMHRAAIDGCLPLACESSSDRPTFLNVDPTNFHETEYSWSDILDTAKERVCDSKNLVFEVSLLGRGDHRMLKGFAREIRQRGFGIALDDWGNGSHSLLLLESIRPDFIKVCSTLVEKASRDAFSQTLLSGLVKVAKDLGIKTVAEGIENGNHLNSAVDAGVEWLQGDHVGLPAAANCANGTECFSLKGGTSVELESSFGKSK